MNTTMTRTGAAIALGAVLALSGANMAAAAEHEATTAEGVASVRIEFGGEFAGAGATVLVLNADADPDAPVEADIAYVAEVVADAEGVASFRAALPAGLDYWLASTVDGGDRYVAMLDGSEGAGDGGDGDGGNDGGGDGGGGDGNDNGNGGDDDGAVEAGPDGSAAGGDDLATTGLAEWMLPAGLLVAGGLIAGGAVLIHRRRTGA